MCIEHVNVNIYRVWLLIDIHRLYCCLIEILFIMKGCLADTRKVFQPHFFCCRKQNDLYCSLSNCKFTGYVGVYSACYC